jgi:hypothetical protein
MPKALFVLRIAVTATLLAVAIQFLLFAAFSFTVEASTGQGGFVCMSYVDAGGTRCDFTEFLAHTAMGVYVLNLILAGVPFAVVWLLCVMGVTTVAAFRDKGPQ